MDQYHSELLSQPYWQPTEGDTKEPGGPAGPAAGWARGNKTCHRACRQRLRWPQTRHCQLSSEAVQRDVKALFGSYTKACKDADELLFRVGKADAVDEACKRSPVGKLLPNALYVHRYGLDSLEPVLRVYEGCGRAYLGEVEGANLIKIHRFSGKVSYLVYPDFDDEPHPRCSGR